MLARLISSSMLAGIVAVDQPHHYTIILITPSESFQKPRATESATSSFFAIEISGPRRSENTKFLERAEPLGR
jgi:hypothetical protein